MIIITYNVTRIQNIIELGLLQRPPEESRTENADTHIFFFHFWGWLDQKDKQKIVSRIL